MTEKFFRDHLIAEYEKQFPLFREYRAVVREHSDPGHSIHDPATGVDARVAAAQALQRVDSPPRHQLDVNSAVAYVRQLEDEIDAQAPRRRDLNELVIDTMFSWSGCVPKVSEWLHTPPEERDDEAKEIAASATDEELRPLLAEALFAVMPTLLFQIAEDDAQQRRRHLGAVPPVGEG